MKKNRGGAKNFKRSAAAKKGWLKRARAFVGKHKGKIALGAAAVGGGLLLRSKFGKRLGSIAAYGIDKGARFAGSKLSRYAGRPLARAARAVRNKVRYGPAAAGIWNAIKNS